jgi:hypothetical protein
VSISSGNVRRYRRLRREIVVDSEVVFEKDQREMREEREGVL